MSDAGSIPIYREVCGSQKKLPKVKEPSIICVYPVGRLSKIQSRLMLRCTSSIHSPCLGVSTPDERCTGGRCSAQALHRHPLSAAPVAGAALIWCTKTLAGLTKSGGASVVCACKTYTGLMFSLAKPCVGFTCPHDRCAS